MINWIMYTVIMKFVTFFTVYVVPFDLERHPPQEALVNLPNPQNQAHPKESTIRLSGAVQMCLVWVRSGHPYCFLMLKHIDVLPLIQALQSLSLLDHQSLLVILGHPKNRKWGEKSSLIPLESHEYHYLQAFPVHQLTFGPGRPSPGGPLIPGGPLGPSTPCLWIKLYICVKYICV